MTNVQLRVLKVLSLIAFVLLCIFSVIDIVVDLREGVSVAHLVHEIGLMLLSFAGILFQLKVITTQNKKIKLYATEIQEMTKEREEFKNKLSQFSGQFMKLIDEQFSLWNLTPGEKDIGILLIKGLSMKEIADLRNSNESTVRQQASSIYRKSGISGRQELTAFFLDDLLIIPDHKDQNN